MMMIANNFNEFVEKVEDAIRTTLNTEVGQEFTITLLTKKLEENPNMTQTEWAQIKSDLMTYIFCNFVTETPEAMKELGEHVYNELQ